MKAPCQFGDPGSNDEMNDSLTDIVEFFENQVE